MRLNWIWLGFWAVALLAAGCVSSGPASRKNMIESPQALDLARRIYAEGQEIKSIVAKGSLRYQEGSRQHFVRFDLAARRPDQLTFTAYDPAGRPALRLYVNGSSLTAIDYLSREVISGQTTPHNLMAFLPLGLNPDQTIIALAGGQPLTQPVKASSTIESSGGQSAALLDLDIWSQGDSDENHWQYRLAGGRDLEVASALYGRPKKLQLSFQYQGYREVSMGRGSRRVPHAITVMTGQGAKSRGTVIRYEQIALNENLSATLFEAPVVEGFKPVDLRDMLGPESI